jgi:ferric-dicitrate binding protein FerR (iron transport regulator)
MLTLGAERFIFKNNTATTTGQQVLYVPSGQRLSFTMQDGTVVWLNAQSSMTYPAVFSNDERRISIEGEVYIEVAKDVHRPFIVAVRGIDVKALGTTLNICNYKGDNEARVSLLEGSIKIFNPDNEQGGILLKPGEEAIMTTDGKTEVTAIRNRDYFLWKDGIYCFESQPFTNIMRRLELYYDIKIEIKDPDMREWKYTGKFRQRDGIDEILCLMSKIHKFNIRKDEENNTFYITR